MKYLSLLALCWCVTSCGALHLFNLVPSTPNKRHKMQGGYETEKAYYNPLKRD